jgi:hypothetical protein
MSNWLKRRNNARKDIEDMERMLTWDYPEEYKDKLRQRLANAKRNQERAYK